MMSMLYSRGTYSNMKVNGPYLVVFFSLLPHTTQIHEVH